MYVDDKVGALEVFYYGVCRLLCHRAVLVAGEDAVHVEVEVWYASLYGVDAERIQRGIYLHLSVERPDALVQTACHLVAHHLPLKLVAVCSCHYAEAHVALTSLYYVFPY